MLEGGNLCQIALRGTALEDPPVDISTLREYLTHACEVAGSCMAAQELGDIVHAYHDACELHECIRASAVYNRR